MLIEITNKLTLTDCPPDLCVEFCTKLTMMNPAYVEAERMGRWTGQIPKLLRYYEVSPDGALSVPRGFIDQLVSSCRAFGVPFTFDDQRRSLPEVDFTFIGSLRPYQQNAVDAMLRRDSGTLESPTGSGKTVIALAIIADRRQPTLILVHTKELLEQWIDRIETFLGIPRADIGVIGGGKRTIGERITVALVQSVYKCADDVAPHIGHIVVDECHRAPSRTFTEAVTAFDCKYMLGLSATPWRRDKLSRLIFWYLGDVRHSVDGAQLVEEGAILRAEVVTRQTEFRPFSDPSSEYSRMLSELTQDPKRNRLIAGDIAKEANNGGGICLCLSDRRMHCKALQRILQEDFETDAEVLTGETPAAQRQDLVERLNAGKVRVLIATGQLIGEGFDCRGLQTLFLATPIRFSGRVIQYLGRVLRPAPGKDSAKLYEYLDNVGVLVAAARARRRVYQQRNN